MFKISNWNAFENISGFRTYKRLRMMSNSFQCRTVSVKNLGQKYAQFGRFASASATAYRPGDPQTTRQKAVAALLSIH